MSSTTSEDRRQGAKYVVSAEEKQTFAERGYVHLRGVLSPVEVDEIEKVYNAFLRREIPVEGKDLNDMTTGEHGTDPTGYAIVNVMLPRRYYPAWVGNIFEQRAQSIAEQLCGEGMTIDFDQLLAKSPNRPEAVFGCTRIRPIGSTLMTVAPLRVGWPSTIPPRKTAACNFWQDRIASR
jgi:hypothetical protein